MIVYRLKYTNVEGRLVQALISDTDGTGDPSYIELTPAASAVRIAASDSDEDKLVPIRSLQATISFISDEATDIGTFAIGRDYRWGVQISLASVVVFDGFLTVDDNQSPFIDGRNVVQLTAVDKLASLKDATYTDLNGDNPRGKYTLAQLCAFALRKTGLSLPIKVVNSLKHGGGTLTANVAFLDTGDNIGVISFPTTIPKLGDRYPAGTFITISGTASNNATFQVQGVTFILGAQVMFVTGPVVTEATASSPVSATIVDETSSANFFDHYLDALTFESDINTSIDPYEVLTLILGQSMSLFYYREAWWIVRHSERYKASWDVVIYDADGEPDGTDTIAPLRNIGRLQDHYFINASTTQRAKRPIGLAKLNYKYNYPKELICNIDFERGDFVEDLPNETVDNEVLEAKKYELDCWEAVDVDRDDGTETTAATMEAYIKKLTNFQGYEKLSYAVLTNGTEDADVFMAIKSRGIPLGQGDKFIFSAAWKLPSQITGSSVTGFSAGLFVLEGENGIKYAWARDIDDIGQVDQKWRTFSDVASSIFDFVSIEDSYIPDDIDSTVFRSVSVEVDGVPVAGNLFIYLYNRNLPSPFDSDIHWSDLNFQYIPLINGSYRLFTGEHHKITRSEDGYNNKIEQDVFMADALRPIFKGGLFFEYNGSFYNTVRWFQNDDNTTTRPYLWWMVFDLWNQYRLEVTELQFEAQGLTDSLPWLIDRVTVTDLSQLTAQRFFTMLTFDMDLQLCGFSGNLQEIYRDPDGYTYDDTYEFKYITT